MAAKIAQASKQKVKINFESIDGLNASIPGVGKRGAKAIGRFRKKHGNITLDNLEYVPKLTNPKYIALFLDFSPNPDWGDNVVTSPVAWSPDDSDNPDEQGEKEMLLEEQAEAMFIMAQGLGIQDNPDLGEGLMANIPEASMSESVKISSAQVPELDSQCSPKLESLNKGSREYSQGSVHFTPGRPAAIPKHFKSSSRMPTMGHYSSYGEDTDDDQQFMRGSSYGPWSNPSVTPTHWRGVDPRGPLHTAPPPPTSWPYQGYYPPGLGYGWPPSGAPVPPPSPYMAPPHYITPPPVVTAAYTPPNVAVTAAYVPQTPVVTSAPGSPLPSSPVTHHHRDVRLPKALQYDGQGDWQNFRARFERYAVVNGWSDEHSKDQLCWNLIDKAGQYWAIIQSRQPGLTYKQLLDKLERRFGENSLPETYLMQLNSATQSVGESLEDWADRALRLADKAYRKLPESYVESQAIMRFCLGLLDPDAGEYVSNIRPATLQESVDKVKWFQHNHRAIRGKSPVMGRKGFRNDSLAPSVRAARGSEALDINRSRPKASLSPSRRSFEQSPPERPKREETSPTLKDLVKSLLKSQEDSNKSHTVMLKAVEQLSQNVTRRDRSPSPFRRSPGRQMTCFNCGDPSHFRRDCPENRMRRSRSASPSDRRVSFKDDTNEGNKSPGNRARRVACLSEAPPSILVSHGVAGATVDVVPSGADQVNQSVEETSLNQIGLGNSGVGVEASVLSHHSQNSALLQDASPNFLPGEALPVEGYSPQTRSEVNPVVNVRQLKSVSMCKVAVEVGGKRVDAVVDTAAEITLISDRLYYTFRKRPPVLKTITLMTAGRDMPIRGRIVGPVSLRIGGKWFKENLYVAPIEDDMLLGFDFIYRERAIVNTRREVLDFGSWEVPLKMCGGFHPDRVARVTVGKRTVIPPASLAHVPCSGVDMSSSFFVEPRHGLRVMIPRTLHSEGSNPVLVAVNLSDNFQVLKKGQWVATASVPEWLSEEGTLSSDVVTRDQPNAFIAKACQVIKGGEGVPEHIRSLMEKEYEGLTVEQGEAVRNLILEFQDVFARGDLDLGEVKGVSHSIDTGSARPVKQRMRRTPVGFADEEENHLNKMLEAGVIRPSVSEWASPPVLIRKRDGGVRWCVDYRALNAVSAKMCTRYLGWTTALDTLAGNEWFSKLDANSATGKFQFERKPPQNSILTKQGLLSMSEWLWPL
ncbi:uncharacterized protein LOC128554171 [Mercenaria mercenaria]|uniref:uncharacterized protein LOC128554171 n=1 Tax=Mercenaria mercenaria TaxID=6596 RepID=UPI00234E783C|nr:uncharacterized protein LOC128554171 [Mercenaria mercenaria]